MPEPPGPASRIPAWLLVLIVVSVVAGGVLAAVAVGVGLTFARRRAAAQAEQGAAREAERASREDEARARTIERIESARQIVLEFRKRHDRIPAPEEAAQMFASAGLERVDAWGRPIRYEVLAEGTNFEFRSFGADGELGGDPDVVATADLPAE